MKTQTPTDPGNQLLMAATVSLIAGLDVASGDVISNFDFTGPPWTAPKESDFATFANEASSVDSDLNSTTSVLSNNPGTGQAYDGGGYDSFYVRDADLTFDPAIFSTSATPGVGMNLANAASATPTNYIAFTVLPDSGYETTYQSMSFFSSSYRSGDTYDVELRAVAAGGVETVLGSYQRTMPVGDNNPVAAGLIDFSDFTASGLTEFRIYAYNIGNPLWGFRMDDIVLNGVTTATGDPSTVITENLTLIDHTFDGVANDTGPAFQQVANGIGTGGSSNLTSGVITVGNADNSTYGFNNVATVDLGALDPSATGFRVTFEVASTTASVADLLNNGLFLGIVSGTNATGTGGASLWNNDPDAFGYLAGSETFGDHVMRQDGDTSYSTGTIQPTNESLQDGFTISISVFDDGTWSVASTGLSTELDYKGFLNPADFSYADIVEDLGLFVSLQGEVGAMLDIDRVTLTSLIHSTANLVPEITSVTKVGDVVTVQFKGTEGETYDLNRSTTLDFSTLDSRDSILLDGTDAGELQDTDATQDAAFYRVEQQ